MKNLHKFEKFVISQKGILVRDNQAVIFRFPDPEMGWDFPGGRLDKGEAGEAAFRREIKEETGLDEFENLGVVAYDIWVTPAGVPVCGIANLIRNDTDEIRLSDEHAEMRWISEAEVGDYKFLWLNAPRMLLSGFRYHKLLTQNKNHQPWPKNTT